MPIQPAQQHVPLSGGVLADSGGPNSAIVVASAGTFIANGATPVAVANNNVTANSQILITLKTVGGAVGTSLPNVRTITVSPTAGGFTVAGIAGDTSTYNYVILG